MLKSGEAISALLARLAGAGLRASPRQIRRWHRAGLLPRPVQEHAKGKPGSETIYPADTGDQLLALCEIRRKIRRIRSVGWRLWWRGFCVHEKYWKTWLRKLAREYDVLGPQIAECLFQNHNREISDRGFKIFRKLRDARTRIRIAPFRQLRKRVSPEDWETFMRLIFEIQSGTFAGWNVATALDDPDLTRDKATLVRGLGLHRARSDRIAGSKPWLEGDIDQPLVTLARSLKNRRWEDFVSSFSDEEMKQARDELRCVLIIALNVADPLEAIFGKHAFGFGVMASIARLFEDRVHAMMFIFWLALRTAPEMRQNVDQFLRQHADAVEFGRLYSALEIKRRDDPEFANILTNERLRRALRDKKQMEQLTDDLRNFHQRH